MTPLERRFPGILVEIPGQDDIVLQDLVTDFNGTLGQDGHLMSGVGRRLVDLGAQLRVTVVTSDTWGSAGDALASLPLSVRIVDRGEEKARIVEELGSGHVVAIGNGRNDIPMLRAAALGIGIIGPEGGATGLIEVADVVVCDVGTALDLLIHPRRLTASLRT